MPDEYPIVEVRPEWALEPEYMGTKEKFWYRKPDDDVDWLFKRPRAGTGEHWAEKIAAEVAGALGIGHATVELAVLREVDGELRGSASESFLVAKHDLFHGNQLLARTTTSYDPEVKRRQTGHSFRNIWEAFGRIFLHREAAEVARTAFSECLTLDAVIGNTDRHHENWGMVRGWEGDREHGWLAPSFDHASSLGRELRDERRRLLLQERRVGAYSEKGRGQVYWSDITQHPPSPLRLARHAAAVHPTHFGPVLARLASLRDACPAEIVNRIPRDWMSPVARRFAIELISYNRRRLVELHL